MVARRLGLLGHVEADGVQQAPVVQGVEERPAGLDDAQADAVVEGLHEGHHVGGELQHLVAQPPQDVARVAAGDPRVDHLDLPAGVGLSQHPLQVVGVRLPVGALRGVGARRPQAEHAEPVALVPGQGAVAEVVVVQGHVVGGVAQLEGRGLRALGGVDAALLGGERERRRVVLHGRQLLPVREPEEGALSQPDGEHDPRGQLERDDGGHHDEDRAADGSDPLAHANQPRFPVRLRPDSGGGRTPEAPMLATTTGRSNALHRGMGAPGVSPSAAILSPTRGAAGGGPREGDPPGGRRRSPEADPG